MKKEELKIDGLGFRHVSQIVRRKMMSKVHKSDSHYNRKDKTWKKYIYEK